MGRSSGVIMQIFLHASLYRPWQAMGMSRLILMASLPLPAAASWIQSGHA
jgi:hypothetical protein